MKFVIVFGQLCLGLLFNFEVFRVNLTPEALPGAGVGDVRVAARANVHRALRVWQPGAVVVRVARRAQR